LVPRQQERLCEEGDSERGKHDKPAETLAERLDRALLRVRVGQPDASRAEDKVDDAQVDRNGALLQLLRQGSE